MSDDDARFEDGAPGARPLRLAARDGDDLRVISALVQDAVLTAADMAHDARCRRFAVLVNRFRWEERSRGPERVRAMLVINDVLRVTAQGLTPGDGDTVLSLLALDFAPDEDGTGTLTLVFAGDGAVRLALECVDVALADVTQPYRAPSGRAPDHPLDDDKDA